MRKNVPVIEKNFWNSRLKPENLQKIGDLELEQFIQIVKVVRFLRSNTLEQLEFKLEKLFG